MKRRSKFAIGHEFQVALRELTSVLSRQTFWAGFICVVAFLTVAGPFGTAGEMPPLTRALYWLTICLATYLPGFLLTRMHWHMTGASEGPGPVFRVLSGALIGVPVGIVVFVINTIVFRIDAPSLALLIELVAVCLPIALAVTALSWLILDAAPPILPETRHAMTDAPALLRRVRPEIWGPVESLRGQDHYVEIKTNRGSELVLMRLADAVLEMDGADGAQVHRSWWVARNSVTDTARSGHKMELILRDGTRVPVGRSRQKTVSEWLGAGGQ